MDWSNWKQASCLPECWCEAARAGSFVLEPVNAWTNISFVSAGIFLMARSSSLSTNTNLLTSDQLFPKLYGLAAIFCGLGSFFFHASQTFAGQWFDVFGMYMMTMFFISYNFHRINCFTKKHFLYFYFLSCTLLGVIIYYFPEARRWLFGASVAFVVLQSIWAQRRLKNPINHHYLLWALVLYGVAQALWVVDKNRVWCDPHAMMNGHGLWHILACCSAFLAYFYFASEKRIS